MPSNYKVLFLHGGASTQFSMVPMNLLGAGATADYIDAGSWAEKAIKEAKKVGTVNVAASSKAENYSRIPAQSELKLTPGAAYVHMTSNNTIEGTEYKTLPDVGHVPLVSDTSSDMFSRPIDVARHGLIYAGAQKNLGPAGVTVVIIREDLLQRATEEKKAAPPLPAMLSYAAHAENGSMYNTPACFADLRARRSGDEVAAGARRADGHRDDQRAGRRPEALRRRKSIAPFLLAAPRSKACAVADLNVTFRLPSEDLEKLFVGK